MEPDDEPPRMERGANGIWRMVFRRRGQLYWSSLNTRDDDKAKRRFDEWMKRLERPSSES